MPVFNWSRTNSNEGKHLTNSNIADQHNTLHNNLLAFRTKPHASQPSSSIQSQNQSRNISPHRMDHLARLGAKRHSRSLERTPTASAPGTKSPHSNKGLNKINMVVESPPAILYGPPETSTGALFSGRLVVSVDAAPEIVLDTFGMQLIQTVTTKRPVSSSCPDCTTKTTELKSWTFIRDPKTLKYGAHEYPFSYLIAGNIPATTIGHLAALEYIWVAKATTRHGEQISFRRPLKVARAIISGADKNSLRIFPPTNLTAHVTMTPLMHAIGDHSVLMRLSGVCEKKTDTQNRWRLRKMTWRIEETEKMLSPACTKHEHKVSGTDGKGNLHEEVRWLGGADLREGWKTDFDSGTIELEFQIRCSGTHEPLCDVASTTSGLGVTHALIVELVVAEEWAPNKKPMSATPTGAARVLRMQFQIAITERSGMGISWDEEQPPMYEDVPASPPLYNLSTSLKDYTGPPLDEMERLALGEPTRPRPTHLR